MTTRSKLVVGGVLGAALVLVVAIGVVQATGGDNGHQHMTSMTGDHGGVMHGGGFDWEQMLEVCPGALGSDEDMLDEMTEHMPASWTADWMAQHMSGSGMHSGAGLPGMPLMH